MKTAELTGAQLDYWVAKALGWKPDLTVYRGERVTIVGGVPAPFELDGPSYDCFAPSTEWGQGGPLIELKRISLQPIDFFSLKWSALVEGGEPYEAQRGTTALQAAMRAFVASKYGDEVPDDQ